MRLAIDSGKCEGHGLCAARAPQLFDVDDYGMSFLLVDKVPDDQHDAAENSINICPEQAISVMDK